MINTAPGAKVTVIGYQVEMHSGIVRHECGIHVSGDSEKTQIMRLTKNGDFSGLILEISNGSIVGMMETEIGPDNLVVMG
jgi:hypothetical protein